MKILKLTALLFALAGLVVLLIHFRQIPGIALGLALTFATYAALKKQLDSKEEELSFEGNDYMDSISLIDIK